MSTKYGNLHNRDTWFLNLLHLSSYSRLNLNLAYPVHCDNHVVHDDNSNHLYLLTRMITDAVKIIVILMTIHA